MPLLETIVSESDLLSRLIPLTDSEIFSFMDTLRGGTYFNMGMYSPITVSRAYKKTIRIYKVVTMTAIVSGVSYENIGTTKDFRDRTGKEPGHAWYDHLDGYENRVGVKKSDPNAKYILWDIKKCSGTCVYYYVVDIATGDVTPISREQVLDSEYLTDSEKKKLMPSKVEGYDKTTGTMIENQTMWRTAAFDHVFWLSQEGKSTKEFGVKFMESINLREAAGFDLFMDGNAHATANLDDILSGGLAESQEAPVLAEADSVSVGEQLYVATNLANGELLGAVWASSETAAYDYFANGEPLIPNQNDDLFVCLAAEAECSFEDIAAEFPDVFDGSVNGEKRSKMIFEQCAEEETALQESSVNGYIIATKEKPAVEEDAFYQVDLENYSFDVASLADATVFRSLGDARFSANQALSMSTLHRIYILDAATLEYVDSLDYYVDYEDEEDYPGYFDEAYKTVLIEDASDAKFYYVICKMYDKIVAHGIQRVNLASLAGLETAEERAITDFFDGTNIAYNGEYDDEDGEFDWDGLTRYSGEISVEDLDKYMRLSDDDAQKLIDDSGLDFIEESRKTIEKSALHESYRRTTSRGKTLNENSLFVDFD